MEESRIITEAGKRLLEEDCGIADIEGWRQDWADGVAAVEAEARHLQLVADGEIADTKNE